MGAMNWMAVAVAAVAASAVMIAAFRSRARRWALLALPANLVSAAMLGHALARIGPDKLAAKPQLYFMQSGGLALAFVIPALWLTQHRDGMPARKSLSDSAVFLVAYLAMGAVFLALG